MKSILIVGSSGKLGKYLLKLIDANEYNIITLNRSPSPFPKTRNYSGDGRLIKTWRTVFNNNRPDFIVILSNIRHSITLLSYLSICGKKYNPRVVIIGTTGVHSKYKNYSDQYKFVENIINYSLKDRNILVLRPSMICGGGNDYNLSKMLHLVFKYRIYPIFGDGSKEIQPVHYQDLAITVSNNIDADTNGFYDVPGLQSISYTELIRMVSSIRHVKILSIEISPKLIVRILKIIKYTPLSYILPITLEQVLRTQEDKTYNVNKSIKELNHRPMTVKALIGTIISEYYNTDGSMR